MSCSVNKKQALWSHIEKNYSLINIYDITGSVVETVINEKIEPGHHEIQWNVTASSSGVYFVELRIGEERLVQKLLYIKWLKTDELQLFINFS